MKVEAYRILLLGGVFRPPENYDRGQEFASGLEKSLSVRFPQRHFRVINATTPYSTALETFPTFLRAMEAYQPSLVIYLLLQNSEVIDNAAMERWAQWSPGEDKPEFRLPSVNGGWFYEWLTGLDSSDPTSITLEVERYMLSRRLRSKRDRGQSLLQPTLNILSRYKRVSSRYNAKFGVVFDMRFIGPGAWSTPALTPTSNLLRHVFAPFTMNANISGDQVVNGLVESGIEYLRTNVKSKDASRGLGVNFEALMTEVGQWSLIAANREGVGEEGEQK